MNTQRRIINVVPLAKNKMLTFMSKIVLLLIVNLAVSDYALPISDHLHSSATPNSVSNKTADVTVRYAATAQNVSDKENDIWTINETLDEKAHRSSLKYPTRLPEMPDHPSCKMLVTACKEGNFTDSEKAVETCPLIDFKVTAEGTPLLIAVRNNCLKIAELLLRKGADVNHEDENGTTPLFEAVDQNNLKMAELLIAHGATINTSKDLFRDNTEKGYSIGISYSPLNLAVEKNLPDITNLLLSKGTSFAPELNEPPLITAVINGHKQMVELIISKGGDVNDSFDGKTLLMYACQRGGYEIAEILLQNGARLDVQEQSSQFYASRTPLDYAAESGRPGMIDLLKVHGTEIMQKNKMGQTAMFWASTGEMVNHLMNQGLDINAKDMAGMTPLFWAVFNGHLSAVQTLMENGADLNVRSDEGHTPIRAATDAGHLEIAGLMIAKGADIHAKDNDGDFALMYTPNPEIAGLLIKHGAKINDSNKLKRTPLMYAAARGLIDIVKILVENGADINRGDSNGLTALMMSVGEIGFSHSELDRQASDSERMEIAEYLLANGADINRKDAMNKTALFHAVEEPSVQYEMVQLLIDRGADIHIEDRSGKTPMMIAEEGIRDYAAAINRFGKNQIEPYGRFSLISDILRQATLMRQIKSGESKNRSDTLREIEKTAARIDYFKNRERDGYFTNEYISRYISLNSLFPQKKMPSVNSQWHSGKRIIWYNSIKTTLDLSTQILGFDVPDDKELGRETTVKEADIYPSISMLSDLTDFASTSVLVQKAKQFDDGLYAAVEILLESETDAFPGKNRLIAAVLDQLRKSSVFTETPESVSNECMGLIAAALHMGGKEVKGSDAVQNIAGEYTKEFLDKDDLSKPIGFYTWSPELERIFQRDRFLQKNLMPEQAKESPEVYREATSKIQYLSDAVTASKTLDSYDRYLGFIQKLTNPFPPEYSSLSRIGKINKDRKYCFFPPSQGPETELMKKLFPEKAAIPSGFSLIDTLINQIRENKISLLPTPASGWYDYQLHALEPLVIPEQMPEARHVHLGDRYKKELTELFKSAVALTRETHIKQLENPGIGAPSTPITIDVFPDISLEPTAEYFLRRGKSYTFIRQVLEKMFTAKVLEEHHRKTPSGFASPSLCRELEEMESLFYGAYGTICRQLGMMAQTVDGRDSAKDIDFSATWITSFSQDPDIGADSRMMVPVFYDIGRRKWKVWVFIGYTVKPLKIWYEKEPQCEVTDESGNPVEITETAARGKPEKAVIVKFHSIKRPLIIPVSAEIYVSTILNREEFRQLCDKYKTRSKILEALEAMKNGQQHSFLY